MLGSRCCDTREPPCPPPALHPPACSGLSPPTHPPTHPPRRSFTALGALLRRNSSATCTGLVYEVDQAAYDATLARESVGGYHLVDLAGADFSVLGGPALPPDARVTMFARRVGVGVGVGGGWWLMSRRFRQLGAQRWHLNSCPPGCCCLACWVWRTPCAGSAVAHASMTRAPPAPPSCSPDANVSVPSAARPIALSYIDIWLGGAFELQVSPAGGALRREQRCPA